MIKKASRTKAFSIRLLTAAVATLGLASAAWAGRPLATEDAGVLNRGDCEIESYAGRARGADMPTLNARWAQVGCGTGFNTELAIGAGREKSEGERSPTAALTGKTFIRELTDEQAGFTFSYAFSGARQSAGSFGHEATELRGVITVPRGDWLFHGNLGWERSHETRTTSSIFGLAVERTGALGPVDLMAEVFGDDRDAPWVQAGARWAVIPKRLFLDGSWGMQTDSKRSRQITVGLKLAF
jgi:hypothetical protein